MIKKYRYIWLPALLLCYGLYMAWVFGPELISAGRAWQVWTFLATDIIVCIVLAIFIRKRSQF